MTTEEQTQLRQAAGLTEADMQIVEDSADEVFVWNVALDDTDFKDWTLLSDQFVQIGRDAQLAIGVWRNDADKSVVRTDIDLQRDAARSVDALVRKLTASQVETFERDPPGDWPGLRFRAASGRSIICLTANMLVDLVLVEGQVGDLTGLSDELIDSILGEDTGNTEEDPAPAPREARVGEAMPLEIHLTDSPKAAPDRPDDLAALLEAPAETVGDAPVTRTDRPDRVVVKSRGSGSGKLKWRSGQLNRVAGKSGDAEVDVTLKRRGDRRRRKVRLKVRAVDGTSERKGK